MPRFAIASTFFYEPDGRIAPPLGSCGLVKWCFSAQSLAQATEFALLGTDVVVFSNNESRVLDACGYTTSVRVVCCSACCC